MSLCATYAPYAPPMRPCPDAPDDQTVAAARRAAMLPVGWTLNDQGVPLSPFARVAGYAWPSRATDDPRHCARTGQPGMLSGPITFTVEPIIDPDRQIKWTNPDGGGEYRITVSNLTDQNVTTTLWQLGGDLLWNQSLLVICRSKVYTLPGTAAPQADAGIPQPLKLQPGESVSTVVNVLTLQGPDWPRGGSRIDFTFALGQHTSRQSLYYMSRHHDKLRPEKKGNRIAMK